jgi:hypothetical protein
MGLGKTGYIWYETGDPTAFQQTTGAFAAGAFIGYRVQLRAQAAAAVPELPASLPRLPNGRTAVPPVEVPPELLPITDNLFRTLYNEVTGTPPPVRQMRVLEGVQAGFEGVPSTAASGQPAITNLPGLNTTPIPQTPGVPPPGVCGLPRALGGAIDTTTNSLPEGPISVVSGGFRLRNVPGGGPREVRLVTNCDQCANLIGQNPGRLTPTGFPPDAVLTVLREPIPL